MFKLSTLFSTTLLCATLFAFNAFAEENTKMPAHSPKHQNEEVSDAVHKELKEYHQKRKALRDALSPEAKDALKKRHEHRKNKRHEKREDRREKIKDKIETHKDKMKEEKSSY